MEKCSSINHKEIEALLFCNDCKLYMCNKCEKHHSELFQEKNHNLIKLEKGKDITEIFTGFCNEKNHKLGLQYFCKKHNILCCGQCVIKIKGKENGQHSDCDICFIEDIENEKRNNLKDNIKCLEDISINIEQKINKIKIISEKIDKSKEDLLTSIQNIFTKLRTTLNEREDELLLEVNNKFNELYINENIIKECDKFHSEMFQNHISIKLEKGKDMKEIFTGFCKEKFHKAKLNFFCKKHNELCCAECIAKLKGKEIGQHSDCDVCFIEDIENEKRNKLKDNIKCLEDISINIEQKINELKPMLEKINKSKEELKTNIQKIFTKLRTALNDREDELLQEVDNKYNELYFNEEIIKDCDKLPNKIKISLEKGKEIENNWNNNTLPLLINNCINIENNIKNIKL